MKTIFVKLTTAGTETGPFNVYYWANNGPLILIDIAVPKTTLVSGLNYDVPDNTLSIQIKSDGLCTNYINLAIATTTTTTSTTSTTSSTTTTTTTTGVATTTTTTTPDPASTTTTTTTTEATIGNCYIYNILDADLTNLGDDLYATYTTFGQSEATTAYTTWEDAGDVPGMIDVKWCATTEPQFKYGIGGEYFATPAEWLVSECTNCCNTDANCLYTPPIVETYGFLYNWYAGTNTDNIANAGWHNLTVTDMVGLRTYLDPSGTAFSNVAGSAMKSTGTTYWAAPNTGASNSSKLDFRGSGSRDAAGLFNLLNASGWFWNTQDLTTTDGGLGQLGYADTNFTCANAFGTVKNIGVVIRLKKNTPTALPDGTIISNGYTGNDGKLYNTVVINGYEWLGSHLKETKYRTGATIPEITNNTAWTNDTTGARCTYVI